MPQPLRAMAVFQGQSNLPEDRYINVFHFNKALETDQELWATDCQSWIQLFYDQTYNGWTVGKFLSPWLMRDYTIQTYDLRVPLGEREPISFPATIAAATTDGLPEEVAVCLSLEGAPPHTPRRRGRLYIGPLTLSTAVQAGASGITPTRVATGTQSITETLAYAASDLVSHSAGTWCIRSTAPTENFVPIVSGWIDNAFDTQRRRGTDPDTRRVWDVGDAGAPP